MTEIIMRQPNGSRSKIVVHQNDVGGVDLHFSRSSAGEMLVRLPDYASKRLADAINAALAAEARPS